MIFYQIEKAMERGEQIRRIKRKPWRTLNAYNAGDYAVIFWPVRNTWKRKAR